MIESMAACGEEQSLIDDAVEVMAFGNAVAALVRLCGKPSSDHHGSLRRGSSVSENGHRTTTNIHNALNKHELSTSVMDYADELRTRMARGSRPQPWSTATTAFYS